MNKPFFLIVAAAVLFLRHSPAADTESSGKSIESLLQDAQSALLNSDKTSTDEVRPRPKKRTISQKTRAPLPDPAPKAEAFPQLTPIDTTAIQNVIAVDLQASQREREPVYPVSSISISGGVHSLKPVYSLMKDDDYFSNDSGGSLGGLYLSFNPSWKIGFLETRVVRTFISVVVQAGYSQGNVQMRRSGIQASNSVYAIKLFPIDVGFQLSVEMWRWLGVFAGYGPGVEIFHQDGLGVNDSTTQVFFGDDIWLGLSGNLSSSIQLFLSYRQKGLGLLFHSSSFGGQIISAGVSFGLG